MSAKSDPARWKNNREVDQNRIILDSAVGRARAGRDASGWQGATTLRARAREEEQRGQRVAARFDRVRSALTQTVKAVVEAIVNVHAV
jgi:hypothetical protein